MAQIIGDPLPRRGLLVAAGAAAAGAAELLSGCGGLGGPGKGLSDSRRDMEILRATLALELAVVRGYQALTGALDGPARATAEAFLDQEKEHANALAKAIKLRGGNPRVERLGSVALRPRSAPAALRAAVRLEYSAIAAYSEAIPRLSAPDIRATFAEICANEAQHLSVLSEALGRPPAPSAFVGPEVRR